MNTRFGSRESGINIYEVINNDKKFLKKLLLAAKKMSCKTAYGNASAFHLYILDSKPLRKYSADLFTCCRFT